MVGGVFQPDDIAVQRLADAQLHPLHQVVPGSEQVASGLGAGAQGLVVKLARIGMEGFQIVDQFGIKVFHAGKTGRRVQVENLHQAVIAVENFIALVAKRAQSHAQRRQCRLAVRCDDQCPLAQRHGLFGVVAVEGHCGGAAIDIRILRAALQDRIEGRRCFVILFHLQQRGRHACGGDHVVRVARREFAEYRQRLLLAVFVGQEIGLVQQQIAGPGRTVIGFQRLFMTVQSIKKLVIRPVPYRSIGLAHDQAFEQGEGIVEALHLLQYLGAEQVQTGQCGVQGLRLLQLFQRFRQAAQAARCQAQIVVQHAGQVRWRRKLQALACHAFGFGETLLLDQQCAQGQPRRLIVRRPGQNVAIDGFRFTAAPRALQGTAQFQPGLDHIRRARQFGAIGRDGVVKAPLLQRRPRVLDAHCVSWFWVTWSIQSK